MLLGEVFQSSDAMIEADSDAQELLDFDCHRIFLQIWLDLRVAILLYPVKTRIDHSSLASVILLPIRGGLSLMAFSCPFGVSQLNSLTTKPNHH